MKEEGYNPDALVVGAGPGGYTAAIRLGQYGLNPLVVEKENVGGVCLNWGCIPTKTLYSTTEPLEKLEAWEEKGIAFSDFELNREQMVAHKDRVVKKLTGGVKKLIEASGGQVLEGRAVMKSRSEAVVKKANGEDIAIRPEHVIIATGSTPIELPGFPFDDEAVWSSRDAVRLPKIPDKLVILGGGVIGLEMATIYGRLGVTVEVLEMADTVLPGMNLGRRFSSLLGQELKRSGIKIHTGTKALELREGTAGYEVIAEEDEKPRKFRADKVLSAVGRSPVSDTTLDGLELEKKDSGYIEIDQRCRTSAEGVYAIGDVAGQPLLAHKASRQGLIAAAEIAGEESGQYRVIPAAVFTDPEYAEVGMSVKEAKNQGYQPTTGSFPFRASGKALAMGETKGMVQLVVDKSTDELLGGAILGPHASDLIGEIALAVEMKITAKELAETVHTHPTLSEAIMEAAENVHGQAIHTGNR
ncbi:MAG: dihydrolipoyl dehydrogenase [Candidatus Bipolaricaulota bacterium]|nr:dihydrolipoyl dehydrogenase [Candidatus Bipolaricaulota bacterium]MBS3791861.1 dihydrolipoyl dehydrogenase [Candidatus Bipolaricaulota bacterium]